MRVETLEQGRVIIGGAKEEGVVDMTAAGSPLKLIIECLERCSLRHGVGHLKIGGHATGGSSTALAIDVGLLGHPRLTEMHMGVDDARQHKAARCIDDIVNGNMRITIYDFLAVDDDRSLEATPLVDNMRPLNQRCHCRSGCFGW